MPAVRRALGQGWWLKKASYDSLQAPYDIESGALGHGLAILGRGYVLALTRSGLGKPDGGLIEPRMAGGFGDLGIARELAVRPHARLERRGPLLTQPLRGWRVEVLGVGEVL